MLAELINKIKEYNPDADFDKITEAFDMAEEHHRGQKRNSGEDYIIHPFNVALILAGMNMDTQTIIAGLLHDTVEDTDVTYDDVKEKFGVDVANIVDGVTKLTKLKYKSKKEKQAENIRKMVLAMAKDIRVVIVKLADRLHNMRTLEYMTPAKKKEKALETIEIYAPIADRLGMSRVKWELEDLSLRYLEPEKYYKLVDMVNKRRHERESLINSIISRLEESLENVGIKSEIYGRPKNFFSIYKKMAIKGKAFDEIYDLSAVRVLVEDIKDCYGVLGVVHTLWKPIPGRFKDYIAMPKPNNYQSLHTTVIDDNGETFEVQIRTYDMHKIAEYGIAAHWKYKSGATKTTPFDKNLTWLRQLLEWQKDLNDPEDFMETLKVDFFADEVFVFTPNGDVINLPEDSTPIDFAYRIHSDVGNTCVGAKVNGRIVPLNYRLKNGNIVEVITNSSSGPSMDWLNIVKSPQARKKITQYFKIKNRDKNIERGEQIIEREIKKMGYRPSDLMKEEYIDEVSERMGTSSKDDLYAGLGFGSITINQILFKLVEIYKREHKKDAEVLEQKVKKFAASENRSTDGIKVKGDADNLKIRFAKCCNPVPGDDIVGYITIGRGISVHRRDCKNIINQDVNKRFINVSWDEEEITSYNAAIEVRALDKPNVISDVANRIHDAKFDLTRFNARKNRDGDVIISLSIEITDKNDLQKMISKLRRVENVLDVYRING